MKNWDCQGKFLCQSALISFASFKIFSGQSQPFKFNFFTDGEIDKKNFPLKLIISQK